MRRTLALLGGVALGLTFSQFPEYAQQYEQRLGGAVDELAAITREFDSAAAAAGLTRGEALARYDVSPDSFLIGRGTSMRAVFARHDRLRAALVALHDAGPIERVEHLGAYLDSDVGARALAAYQPAVPVTGEGLGWAAAGGVLGYLVLYPLIGLVTLPFRWRRGRPPHRKVPIGRRAREQT